MINQLSWEGKFTVEDVEALKSRDIWKFEDIRKSQLRELFEIDNPALIGTKDFDNKLSNYIADNSLPTFELSGSYVYFPWSGLLIHTVSSELLTKLRTNRKMNLVTNKEQKNYLILMRA